MSSAPAPASHEPRPDLGRLAVARRLAAGYTPAEAGRAARVPGRDVDAMLADPGFAELVDAYRDVEDLPRDQQVARLVRVAKCVIEDALNRGDAHAALFIIRQGEALGRDPAVALAEQAVRTLRRRAAAIAGQASSGADPAATTPVLPAGPASLVRRDAAPARPNHRRLLWRAAAKLRAALLAEAGCRTGDLPRSAPAARRVAKGGKPENGPPTILGAPAGPAQDKSGAGNVGSPAPASVGRALDRGVRSGRVTAPLPQPSSIPVGMPAERQPPQSCGPAALRQPIRRRPP